MSGSCIVGLDYGSRRIGVAISDTQKKIAFPLDVIQRHGESYGLKQLKELLGDRKIEIFVVGVPLRKNGELSDEGIEVLTYVESLKSYFKLEAVTWDESYTTVEAERTLISGGLTREQRKKVIDKLSAQIILQSYLDHTYNR
jgi:putative Holliday junction resolvase